MTEDSSHAYTALGGSEGRALYTYAGPSVPALILFSCLSTQGDQELHEAKSYVGLIPGEISVSMKPHRGQDKTW